MNGYAKEAFRVGFDYFKANAGSVSASVKVGDHDYHLHVVELHNTGPTTAMTLTAFIALCSAVMERLIQRRCKEDESPLSQALCLFLNSARDLMSLCQF